MACTAVRFRPFPLESRGVVANPPGFWGRGRWFKSSRDYEMNQITENLWIGDIQDVWEGDTSQFDRVITVCQDEVSDNVGCRYNFFNMSDGPHNGYGGDSSYEMFHEAAITLLGALSYGEEVLIHCHMGQSRSVSVAAAALAIIEEMTYQRAFELIETGRPQAHPDPHLRSHAEDFIENYTP